ncbi:UNVERIFIED_CONTAM: hypothetical protein Sradi_4410800 [Sesamum radiatum]|uniref:Secreted protein n=1 Tax=Sesamum radiatum TaxID=300843 RepID=A0AAW2NPI3_SESRA
MTWWLTQLVAVTLQLPLLAHKHDSSDSTADGCMFDDSAMPDDMYSFVIWNHVEQTDEQHGRADNSGKNVDNGILQLITWRMGQHCHVMTTDSAPADRHVLC